MKWYELLKLHRERKGIKKSHFAARIGVKPATITEWENGLTESPSVANALRICEELDLTIDELFNISSRPVISTAQSEARKQVLAIIKQIPEDKLDQLSRIASTFIDKQDN